MSTLIWGLITGIIFGFLLQKGQVLRYEKQLGALLFKDFTIVKFMLSTVIISMIGIYLLYDLGLIKLDIKATSLGANIIGGLVFGIGWGLLGYCPATAAGALGEGRWDSLFGIIGMLFGASFYAEAYPALKTNILAWGKKGEITLYGILGINHWIIILILIIIFCIVFYWFEKKKL